MIHYNVNHDPYIALVTFGDEIFEILFCAKLAIHGPQILEPVAMISCVIVIALCHLLEKKTIGIHSPPAVFSTMGEIQIYTQ